MDGIPHREVPPPQNRTRKNCRQTECFNVAFVVRADLTIQTKGLTASALAAKFRDEFETVRCGALRCDEGGEIVVKVRIDIERSHRIIVNCDKEREKERKRGRETR